MSEFRVPFQAAESEFTEKRSRFIGYVQPVEGTGLYCPDQKAAL